MRPFLKIILIVSSLLFTSCIDSVKELDYPDGSKKKLLVFSIISPDQNYLKVHVRSIRPFFNNKFTDSDAIKDAKVVLSDGINNVALYYTSFNPQTPDLSYYTVSSNNFKIVPGMTYYLTVTTPEGWIAEAYCTVPGELRKSKTRQQPFSTENTGTLFPYTITVDIDGYAPLYRFNALMEYTTQQDSNATVSKEQWMSMGYFVNPVITGGKMEINYSNYQEKKIHYSEQVNFKKILCWNYDENLYTLYLEYWRKNKSNSQVFVNEKEFYLDPSIFNIFNIGSNTITPKTNIVPGSVTVLAGSNALIEGPDYAVDYSLGSVKIKNRGILQSGQEIRIKVKEDNSNSMTTGVNSGSDTNAIPTEELFFVEPENKYSNIKGGIGIFGAYNVTEVETP